MAAPTAYSERREKLITAAVTSAIVGTILIIILLVLVPLGEWMRYTRQKHINENIAQCVRLFEYTADQCDWIIRNGVRP